MVISELRKELNDLIKERQKYEQIILNRDVLLEGMYREFYKTCGNKKCFCITEGRKHGPYHKIEVIRDRKQKVYYVPKDKVQMVVSLDDNRIKFNKSFDKIKELNDQIYEVIKKIKKEKEKRVDKRWLK